MEDLKDLIKESILTEELKQAYLEILPEMNEEEKNELKKIIEEGNIAKTKYDEGRLERLDRLNKALEKHLQNVSHQEERNVREEFEKMDQKESETELQNLEQQINNL